MSISYTVAENTRKRMRNDAMDEEIASHLPRDGQWTGWSKPDKDGLMFVLSPMNFRPASEQAAIQYHYQRTGPNTGWIETHTINGNGGGRIWLCFEQASRGTAHASTSSRHASFQFKNLCFELSTPQNRPGNGMDNSLHNGPMNLSFDPIPGLPE